MIHNEMQQLGQPITIQQKKRIYVQKFKRKIKKSYQVVIPKNFFTSGTTVMRPLKL